MATRHPEAALLARYARACQYVSKAHGPSTIARRSVEGRDCPCPAINAAACAALAVLCVLHGDMDTDFWAVAEQAVAKAQEARAGGAARIVGSGGPSIQLDGSATG